MGRRTEPLRTVARASPMGLPPPPLRRMSPEMITAQKLEVRAGARLLMEDVTFRIAAGDKVGLVGRNGAGKTTLTRILAGEGTPADGQVLRSGEVGYLPQDPRVGDPEVIARDRILSARGLDDVVRRLREAEVEMADEDPGDPRARHEAVDARRRRAPRRWRVRRRVRGRADGCRPRDRGAHPRPADRHPVRWPATPRRARPHPVLGRRDHAAGRAHQPPRRRLDRVAARLPQGAPRRLRGHQPRQRAARGDGQQGLPPRRQPRGHRRLQHGLAQLPDPARGRREASQARADERREQGQGAHRPGQQDAGQGDARRRPRSRCSSAPRR